MEANPNPLLTKKDLEEIKKAMTKLQVNKYPVQPSNVLYDFSEPRKVNEWINLMRSSTNMAGEKFARPAGFFGHIRYYQKSPISTVQPKSKPKPQPKHKHEIFEFLVNSGDTRAVKTEDLNYLCYSATERKTYILKPYSAVISWVRNCQAEEIAKFARNVLRLIKGKSFLNPEKLLKGQKQTIEASLEVVSILLTSESLRDPRCRYLAITEFYKLRKGKISLDDMFHPSKGRYIPARKAQVDITEEDKKQFTQEPKNPSRLPMQKEGGASQIRALDTEKDILPHFYDEEMQAIYKDKIKSMVDDVIFLERADEKIRVKFRLEYQKGLKELEDQFEIKIKEIKDRLPEQTQEMEPALKQELEEALNDYEGKKQEKRECLDFDLGTAESYETVIAQRKLQENSPFSKWCLAKFKEAHDLFEVIQVEPSEKDRKAIISAKDG